MAAKLFDYNYDRLYEKDQNIIRTNHHRKYNVLLANDLANCWLSVASKVGVADPNIGNKQAKTHLRKRNRTEAGSPHAASACANKCLTQNAKSIQSSWNQIQSKMKGIAIYILNGTSDYKGNSNDAPTLSSSSALSDIIARIDLLLLGWNLLESRLNIQTSKVLEHIIVAAYGVTSVSEVLACINTKDFNAINNAVWNETGGRVL